MEITSCRKPFSQIHLRSINNWILCVCAICCPSSVRRRRKNPGASKMLSLALHLSPKDYSPPLCHLQVKYHRFGQVHFGSTQVPQIHTFQWWGTHIQLDHCSVHFHFLAHALLRSCILPILTAPIRVHSKSFVNQRAVNWAARGKRCASSRGHLI